MEKYTTITTEEQYDRYNRRMGAIFLAEKGTPEYAESTILADLIKVYEDTHFTFDPPDEEEAKRYRDEQVGTYFRIVNDEQYDRYHEIHKDLSSRTTLTPKDSKAIMELKMRMLFWEKHRTEILSFEKREGTRNNNIPIASNKTLKQYYAGLAMQGILARGWKQPSEVIEEVDLISTLMVEKFGTK